MVGLDNYKLLASIVNYTEAVLRRCSSKYVFLKILQISHENTCVGISFDNEIPT